MEQASPTRSRDGNSPSLPPRSDPDLGGSPSQWRSSADDPESSGDEYDGGASIQGEDPFADYSDDEENGHVSFSYSSHTAASSNPFALPRPSASSTASPNASPHVSAAASPVVPSGGSPVISPVIPPIALPRPLLPAQPLAPPVQGHQTSRGRGLSSPAWLDNIKRAPLEQDDQAGMQRGESVPPAMRFHRFHDNKPKPVDFDDVLPDLEMVFSSSNYLPGGPYGPPPKILTEAEVDQMLKIPDDITDMDDIVLDYESLRITHDKTAKEELGKSQKITNRDLNVGAAADVPVWPSVAEVKADEEGKYDNVTLVKLENGVGDRTAQADPAYYVRDMMPNGIGFILVGGHEFPIKSGDVKRLEHSTEDGEVDVTIKFSQLGVAPNIKVSAVMQRGRHPGAAKVITWRRTSQFYFSKVNDKTGTPFHGIIPGSLRIERHPHPEFPYIDIQFMSEGAVESGLNAPVGWNNKPSAAEKEVDGYLSKISKRQPPGKPLKVSLRAYAHSKDVDNANDPNNPQPLHLLDTLPNLLVGATQLPAITKPALWPYKQWVATHGGSYEPQLQFGQMKARADIVRSGAPFVPHPKHTRFLDNTAGAIAIGYGAYLEHVEITERFKALSRDVHSVALFKVQDFVIASIKFTKSPEFGFSSGREVNVPAGTVVTLKIATGKDTTDQEVEGQSVENDLGIPGAELAVLLMGKNAREVSSSASYHDKYGFNAQRYYKVNVTVKVNTSVVKTQIDAVHKAFATHADASPNGALLPLLLHDGRDLPASDIKNPFAQFHDPEKGAAALEEFRTAVKWNPSQNDAVEHAQNLPYGVGIVTGPGGSGKSLLQAKKIRAVTQTGGDYVLITSERNSVCDNMVDVLHKNCPDLLVVRSYAMPQSLSEMAGAQLKEASPEVSEATLLVIQILQAKLDMRKKHRRGREEISVEHHIVYNINDKKRLRGEFTTGEIGDDGEAVLDPYHPHGFDVYEWLGVRLQRLKDHPFSEQVLLSDRPQRSNTFPDGQIPAALQETVDTNADPNQKVPYWTEEEKGLLKRALAMARDDVIRNANVLICTLSHCASEFIRKNFAPDKNRNVWVEIDEAFTISEASLWIPLAKCWTTFGCRIVSYCMYGDPHQLAPLILGSQGGRGSRIPGFNEFGAQLRYAGVQRLIDSGIRFTKLNTQNRMHRVLFAPANEIFYDDEITTPPGGDFDLPPEYQPLLRKLLGVPSNHDLSAFQERWVYLEFQDITTRMSPSGSRGNWAHFLKVMDMIKNILHPMWGKRMAEKVLIITPYDYQRKLYNSALTHMRFKYQWTDEEVPRIITEEELPRALTVDSAIGAEADHVIIDLVVDSSRHQGFLRDEGRAAVMMTRARKACWIVSSKRPQDAKWYPVSDDIDNHPALQQETAPDAATSAEGEGWGTAPDSASTPAEGVGWGAAPNAATPAEGEGWGAAPDSASTPAEGQTWVAAPDTAPTPNDGFTAEPTPTGAVADDGWDSTPNVTPGDANPDTGDAENAGTAENAANPSDQDKPKERVKRDVVRQFRAKPKIIEAEIEADLQKSKSTLDKYYTWLNAKSCVYEVPHVEGYDILDSPCDLWLKIELEALRRTESTLAKLANEKDFVYHLQNDRGRGLNDRQKQILREECQTIVDEAYIAKVLSDREKEAAHQAAQDAQAQAEADAQAAQAQAEADAQAAQAQQTGGAAQGDW